MDSLAQADVRFATTADLVACLLHDPKTMPEIPPGGLLPPSPAYPQISGVLNLTDATVTVDLASVMQRVPISEKTFVFFAHSDGIGYTHDLGGARPMLATEVVNKMVASGFKGEQTLAMACNAGMCESGQTSFPRLGMAVSSSTNGQPNAAAQVATQIAKRFPKGRPVMASNGIVVLSGSGKVVPQPGAGWRQFAGRLRAASGQLNGVLFVLPMVVRQLADAKDARDPEKVKEVADQVERGERQLEELYFSPLYDPVREELFKRWACGGSCDV